MLLVPPAATWLPSSVRLPNTTPLTGRFVPHHAPGLRSVRICGSRTPGEMVIDPLVQALPGAVAPHAVTVTHCSDERHCRPPPPAAGAAHGGPFPGRPGLLPAVFTAAKVPSFVTVNDPSSSVNVPPVADAAGQLVAGARL